MAVADAGVNISALHETGIERSRIRLATNFTARRNGLPDHHCGRTAKYRTLVRPLLASITVQRWQPRPLTKHPPGRRSDASCTPRFGAPWR